jgi:O-Antigen ligase
LITAQDIAIHRAAPPMQVAATPASTATFTERLLLMVLYATVLASSVAFIEPSPHDGLMVVLALTCIVVGVRVDRHIALLFLLLLIWNFAGLLSLLNVPGLEQTIQYSGTSIYLALAAVLFASLFAHHTMPRLVTVRAAYVLTATMVSLAGIAGYFRLFPGAYELFAPYGRALGAFKDPNVFGPFLIWPALVVLDRILVRRIRIIDLTIVGILLLGLLLSYSRGAWIHFGVSCVVMLTLAFLTAPTSGARMRIFAMSAVVVVLLAAFIAILLSFDSIADMFQTRAHLVQDYDVGQGGRFRLQELALSELLKFPNGMGPFEFSRVHGSQQHNVYLQAFLVYGWAGGMAYLTLLSATIWTALRTVFVRTPWQPYLICAFAAFVGEVVEGFVIDTDHWRHFFFLLGMIWGLAAATLNLARLAPAPFREADHVSAA